MFDVLALTLLSSVLLGQYPWHLFPILADENLLKRFLTDLPLHYFLFIPTVTKWANVDPHVIPTHLIRKVFLIFHCALVF